MANKKKIIFVSVGIVVASFAIFRIFIGPHYIRITDSGMVPTIGRWELSKPFSNLLHIDFNKDACAGCIVVYSQDGRQGASRIIGMPGDIVTVFGDNTVAVNGIKQVEQNEVEFVEKNSDGVLINTYRKYDVTTGNISHSIVFSQKLAGKPLAFNGNSLFGNSTSSLLKDACNLSANEMVCTVKNNTVFIFGDNRGRTRFGIIPIESIVGINKPIN